MKTLWVALILVSFPLVSAADDTIYCPQDKATLVARCRQVGEDMRSLEPRINRMENGLNNPNLFVFEKINFHRNQNGYYRAANSWVNFKTVRSITYNKEYVLMTSGELVDYLRSTYGTKNSRNKYKVALHYSNQNKNQLLSPGGDMAQAKHTLQQLFIFKAQCCGSTASPSYEGVQPRQGSGNPPGLLGVPFPGSK